MKRYKHTLSSYRLQSGVMGKIYPIALHEVLPGDTWQCSSDILLRLKPLNTPVMHPTQIRVHHFFVANRNLWDGWEDFITGESTSAIPTVSSINSVDARHYLGAIKAGDTVNSLPLRAYNSIINEYFLDQDLQTQRSDTDVTLANCAWEKDYLTTARPFSQKGSDVTIPLGDTAPVIDDGTGNPSFTSDGVSQTTALYSSAGSTEVGFGSSGAATGELGWNNPRLVADLSNATGADINDVRKAFAIQRYQEARARYGSRFTEYLRYLGITPSDARLNRPELLGGGVAPVNFSEVLQTTPNSTTGTSQTTGVGDLYGHGIAGFTGNSFRKFFEEHGFIMTLASVRPKHVLSDGIPRHFLKLTKEDYYQRELEHIGQQEVWKSEVMHGTGNKNLQWGFQDRYDEYRKSLPQVFGQFRNVLNTWHMARSLPDDVALNEDFIKCEPSERIFQVANEDNLMMFVNNHAVARRLVSRNAKARVI